MTTEKKYKTIIWIEWKRMQEDEPQPCEYGSGLKAESCNDEGNAFNMAEVDLGNGFVLHGFFCDKHARKLKQFLKEFK